VPESSFLRIKNGFGVNNREKMDRNLHSSGLKTDQALIIRNGTPGIAADAAAVMAVQDLMSGRMLTENPVYAGPVSVYHAIHCLSALSGEQIIKPYLAVRYAAAAVLTDAVLRDESAPEAFAAAIMFSEGLHLRPELSGVFTVNDEFFA